MSRVKKEDTVMIISGKDRGKKGKVLKTFPSEKKIIVEGVNFTKKHQRPTNQYREGGIIERESPIYVSKVMVVCPNCNKPTRVAHKILENGEKVRSCKKCGEIIDKV
ncbi:MULTISPECIES: 50S ribosomal protein L24 [Mesotoga]|jgi:large subunit ribosomal protein L24|uniref:Large ribosomal subunit protein uL24 n=1 Tax=Mesotoga prima MesG1.Ag.4.2 TaxID=660470 RepID=I2F3A2_9BACT|nr:MULTISPECIES: 50S ribosomal protein L24 [Mesotoga]CCU85947.1 50S ribosomal protein L24 [Mesotoga infera]AFK06405.1 ribosomal protein L24, bacterial/organelle [Mesotoga prima MesG1.Ag.4.2]MCB1222881.1 50S ribosomal protein L24 [Mesotoga sp.]MDK2943504.1 large subunit ribosomal protein [Mesotoga sp.]RLL87762.1 50S ribosomal protein L24 [Mesotoga sp. H07pep.5.4]